MTSAVADFERFNAELVVWQREAGKVAGAAVDIASRDLYRRERGSVTRASGDLYRSITRDTGGRFRGGKYARRVYSLDPAAVFNEYGKEGQPPKPFVGQHIDPVFAELERRIADSLPGFPSR